MTTLQYYHHLDNTTSIILLGKYQNFSTIEQIPSNKIGILPV